MERLPEEETWHQDRGRKSEVWGVAVAGNRPEPRLVPLADMAAELGVTADELVSVPAVARLAAEDFGGAVYVPRQAVLNVINQPPARRVSNATTTKASAPGER